MRILQTDTDGINVSSIKRVAYLSVHERYFLSEKTGRPDPGNFGLGEVIADVGKAIPVRLTFVDDELDGSFIVAALVKVLAHGEQKDEVIDFYEIRDVALRKAEEYRRRTAESGE